MRIPAILAATLLASSAWGAHELKSPDGQVAISIDAPQEQLVWSVSYAGRPILADGRLGLVLRDAPPLDTGLKIARVSRSARDEQWNPPYGERSVIRDHCNQMLIELEDGQSPPRRLILACRAYDQGVAIRYELPAQPGLQKGVIAAERTQFRFTADHTAWAVYSAQGVYSATPISRIKPNCERPLTVRIADDLWIAAGEARLVDYARMRFAPAKDAQLTLEPMLGSEVAFEAPFATPWRVVLVGRTTGELLERNDLFLNLNDPQAIADASWIRPGKVIRETTLSTAGGKSCIDFAVAQGLQYVEYDAGWYGHEYDDAADARTVDPDPKRTGGRKDLDLSEVIRYGNERGIGVILYVNRRALERQLDEILPLYQRWGVKGVKYGFVNVGPQRWTAWLHDAVRKASEHRLMVDVHDEYRPTGFSRTYPNLMTVEGVGGNETMPTPEHNCTLPFTRFLCGPADATICWYSDRIKTSRAHQLALAVVFYSPWQFLYWYDRPAMHQGERETEFFKHVPTTWDDTRVLQGRIGEFASIARRYGREWYVGTINAVERRTLRIDLSFLDPGVRYRASIYSDGSPDGADSKAVGIREIDVDSASVIEADLAANGGQAIRLVPLPPQRINIDAIPSPILLKGDAKTAWRDPAVLYHDGFHLFCTLVRTEADGLIYSYTALTTSRDLVNWTEPRLLTPRDRNLNFCSPGNVVRFGEEWVLCLQTYPRPKGEKYGNADSRLWTMRSRDLVNWSKPELLRVKGPDVPVEKMGRMIDPYLLRDKDDPTRWWCFYKQNGVSMSWSRGLENWTYFGRADAGENACVLVDGDEYILFHSPANGIGVKRSRDLKTWRDEGLITLGQKDWPWAKGRLTAGFVLDLRRDPAVGRYIMFFHGSGPEDERTMFNTHASVGIAWSDDLRQWRWP